MKRFYLMLTALIFMVTVAVGYSDSHVTKKDSFQADKGYDLSYADHASDLSVAELPVMISVDAPYLGRPVTIYSDVSAELAKGFILRVRPPPDGVSKIRI